jgi:hypothetical protein
MSLGDILQVYAEEYIAIGALIQELTTNPEEFGERGDVTLASYEIADIVPRLRELRGHCGQIQLSVSADLAEQTALDLETKKVRRHNEMRVAIQSISRAITSELEDRVFLFIPPERAEFWQSFPGPHSTNPWARASVRNSRPQSKTRAKRTDVLRSEAIPRASTTRCAP